MRTPRRSQHSSPGQSHGTPAARSLARAGSWSSTVFDPAYRALSGSHRIQRVPAGEKRGRRHSSEVTVVVFDDGPSTRLRIDRGDVREDVYRSSGAGGQHRNKVETAIRLTHLATGTVVTATEERSQHRNRQVAWDRLRSTLEAEAQRDAREQSNGTRSAMMDEFRSFTWTGWRDEVRGPASRTSMSKALAGRLDPLLG